MTSVTLEKVTKSFDDVVAVRDVDITINDGEFVTIVGPSGCGKTTTLRCVAGLERPNSGAIKFGEKDVTDLTAKNRGVGMVFQNLALYPHMTARENMQFGLNVANVDSETAEDRIETIAGMLGITELLDRKPGQLSGGQQQRVAIGRTLVLEPDVFLLDEPLASLDAKLRVEIREELQQLQNELEITTIYVTHDQEQAMTMSDRLVVMNDGEVQQYGPPSDLYEDPANEFVGHFIGTPSMNFFEVEVTHGSTPTARLPFADWESTVPDVPESTKRLRLGIRPEHVGLGGPGDGSSFPATVKLVEHRGPDRIVHFDVEDYDIVSVLSDGQAITEGETVPVTFDPDNVHLFTQSGEAVH